MATPPIILIMHGYANRYLVHSPSQQRRRRDVGNPRWPIKLFLRNVGPATWRELYYATFCKISAEPGPLWIVVTWHVLPFLAFRTFIKLDDLIAVHTANEYSAYVFKTRDVKSKPWRYVGQINKELNTLVLAYWNSPSFKLSPSFPWPQLYFARSGLQAPRRGNVKDKLSAALL